MRRNGGRVCKMIGLAVLLVLATGSRTALAQDNFYALSYFSNAHTSAAPDATLRLVNDGFISDSSPAGDLCASTYVFDNNEEMMECCSCRITPNGLLTLSVNTNLTSNTLTKVVPTRGVIKVLSEPRNHFTGMCDPTLIGGNELDATFGIRGWLTRIQKNSSSSFSTTEEELLASGFPIFEALDLAEDCTVLVELGSGRGKCDCTDAAR